MLFPKFSHQSSYVASTRNINKKIIINRKFLLSAIATCLGVFSLFLSLCIAIHIHVYIYTHTYTCSHTYTYNP